MLIPPLYPPRFPVPCPPLPLPLPFPLLPPRAPRPLHPRCPFKADWTAVVINVLSSSL